MTVYKYYSPADYNFDAIEGRVLLFGPALFFKKAKKLRYDEYDIRLFENE